MVVKQKIKFKFKDNENKSHNVTITVCGRNTTELNGRVEKLVNRKLHIGWELR